MERTGRGKVQARAQKERERDPGYYATEIVQFCSSIYEEAEGIYRVLERDTASEGLARLWRHMAEGLQQQVLYWRELSGRVAGDRNLEIVGNPETALQELGGILAKVLEIRDGSGMFRSVMEYFHVAYSLEVQLVHPLLHGLPEAVFLPSDRSMVKWDYAYNLMRLKAGMGEYCGNDPLLTAMVDSLDRMWEQNTRLEALSATDAVTGAFRRGAFLDLVAAFSNLAERNGDNVAFVMVHMDNLPELYRTFELKAADEGVQRFYAGMKSIVRLSDVIGRYDFSTFVIFLASVNQQFLYDIAERIAESICSFQRAGFVPTIHIGGSYGPVRSTAHKQPDFYLRNALDCLMRAKLSRSQKIIIE